MKIVVFVVVTNDAMYVSEDVLMRLRKLMMIKKKAHPNTAAMDYIYY